MMKEQPQVAQLAPVRRSASLDSSATGAISEVAAGLDPATAELVVLFISPDFDRDEIESAVAKHFGAARVIGCTTAGEFGPSGYHEQSISGFSLSGEHFSVELSHLHALTEVRLDAGEVVMEKAMGRMRERGRWTNGSQCFGLVLIDGLSMREEACLLYTSPSPRDRTRSRMPSSA